MPLVSQYETFTTARIAEAAGVDEAALLAEFDDTDAVMRACMEAVREAIAAAFDPSEALERLDAVAVDQPLAARLVAVVDIMDDYYGRARARLDDVQQMTSPGGVSAARPPGREDLRVLGRLPEIRQAVVRLLEPDRDRLRLPPEVLAEAFLGMSHGAARAPGPGRSPLPAGRLVDLFLHGAWSDG
jgi:AcrR family transcriptional regulator